MGISWESLSAGAMTAAVSLGSTVESMGSAAAQALPRSVGAAAATSRTLAEGATVVGKPVAALKAAAPQASMLTRTAGFLVKALPIVTIGASALSGWQVVTRRGPEALVNTKQGRGAVLGAAGGALMLVPHPATQLAAAGMLGATAVNHFGGMDRLNRAHPRLPWDPKVSSPKPPPARAPL